MSLAILYSRTSSGIDAPEVSIEVHISPGLPKLSIVGLPETAVKESKDRVRSALLTSNFEFPNRRITINLAPADLPKKDGGRFDLAIAIGILAASKQIPSDHLHDYEFAGELSLDGELRGFHGVLPFALATRLSNRILIVPEVNADEATLPEKITVLAVSHLLDVCSHLIGQKIIEPYRSVTNIKSSHDDLDMADVYGQQYAKRALEIAASGQHSLLMIGPPGTGKSMLANRLPGILPEMTEEEALESAAIRSTLGKELLLTEWRTRPFRSPHHTASSVALVGGSNPPRPGEISLAHNGVLFLDELPEFNRSVLEALREPLESGWVTISRAVQQAKFPANFQLIAAMNPCPCGYFGNKQGNCHCSAEQIRRYQNRISGPFLDRIDIYIEVPPLSKGFKIKKEKRETSDAIKSRVAAAKKLQYARAKKSNSSLSSQEIEKFSLLTQSDYDFLEQAIERMKLSMRAYHRILKVARTIADLDQSTNVTIKHLAEAINYRKPTKFD